MHDELHILGHVIGLSAMNPETWTCSCDGKPRTIEEMANHMQGQIQEEIGAKLAEAKTAGLLPLKGA